MAKALAGGIILDRSEEVTAAGAGGNGEEDLGDKVSNMVRCGSGDNSADFGVGSEYSGKPLDYYAERHDLTCLL